MNQVGMYQEDSDRVGRIQRGRGAGWKEPSEVGWAGGGDILHGMFESRAFKTKGTATASQRETSGTIAYSCNKSICLQHILMSITQTD